MRLPTADRFNCNGTRDNERDVNVVIALFSSSPENLSKIIAEKLFLFFFALDRQNSLFTKHTHTRARKFVFTVFSMCRRHPLCPNRSGQCLWQLTCRNSHHSIDGSFLSRTKKKKPLTKHLQIPSQSDRNTPNGGCNAQNSKFTTKFVSHLFACQLTRLQLMVNEMGACVHNVIAHDCSLQPSKRHRCDSSSARQHTKIQPLASTNSGKR